MACYCGNESDYEACCGVYHRGEAKALTAEALMRARYSAYATQNIDFVVATHDPETADEVDREGAEKWSAEATWEGLDIVETEGGGPADDTGTVEFVAHYSVNGSPFRHHERAEFRKRDDVWYFVDGALVKQAPVRREQPKVGRNEPCPCGSGKKFKKCHGA